MAEEIDFSMFNPEDLSDITPDPIEPTPPVDPNDPGTPDPNHPPADPPDPTDPPADPADPSDPPDFDGDDGGQDIKIVYSNIAKLLKERELFTDDELDLETITDSDKLVEALKGEIKKNEFADLSVTQKKYLEAVREGVPDDIFMEHQQAEAGFSAITEDMLSKDAELRENIIMSDLLSKGVSKPRATALYKSLEASGEDVAEALESLTNIKAAEADEYQAKLDAIKAQKQTEEDDNKSRFDRLKNSVYDTKEIIKNYKITDTLRDKVYATMTKAVSTSKDGQPVNKFTSEREKDPVGFDTKLYYLFEMTKGFKDFSIFEKKAQSKAARELERVVSRTNILNTGSASNISDPGDLDIPSIVELSDD
jgi:hypothetical protein